MPFNKDAYSRYKLIDARLRSTTKPQPTLADLVDYVSDKLGKQVSVRTLQTDIYHMRYDEQLAYHAPIAYDKGTRRYRYDVAGYSIDKMPLGEEDLLGLDIAVGILHQFKDLPALRQFEDAITRIATTLKRNLDDAHSKPFLKLDRPAAYKGIEYLQLLVDAIQEHRVLKLAYQSFARSEPKEHRIQPYFIKEYKGRLYLVAMDVAAGKMPKMLMFALDRFAKLQETYDRFKPDNIDTENYFKYTLGVSYTSNEPQDIRLRFAAGQAAYVRSQPIHHSQEIISDKDAYTDIALRLVINTELKMIIAEYGSGVEVLAPPALREWFTAESQKLSQIYGASQH
jgi:predicted DNA-binding transcriptional regulator YafY